MKPGAKNSARRRPQPKDEPRKFVSYHASRQTAEQTVVNKRKSPTKLTNNLRDPKRLPIILMLVVAAACILYTTTLTTSSKVVVARPSGVPELRSIDAYTEAADELLGGSILNRNKVTINTTDLQQKLLARFPELDSVNVVLPLMGHRVIVEAVSAKPALRLISNNEVFLISTKGKVMMPTKDLQSKVVDVPTVTDEAALDLVLGKAALSTQDVTFITTLTKQLASQKITVNSLVLPPLASELHAKVNGAPYYIKFSLLTNPRIAVGQYIALSKNLAKDKVVPKEYVDSRIEEKIYYR